MRNTNFCETRQYDMYPTVSKSVLLIARRVIYVCLMNGYIRLKAVLEKMEEFDHDGKPVKFNLKFVTCDRKRGTGGEIIEIVGGRKCVGIRNGKVVYDKRKTEVQGPSRYPHHWVNATRNIVLPNGAIRKVHIRLIIEFNGQKVCY